MDDVEKRARELLAAERKKELSGCAIRAIVAALTPPEGYVSREEMLSAMDRAFYDGMSKAEPQIPEGYVLVQVLDAERLCNHVTHSPSSALAARRVQGLIKASRGSA